jgi:hypothetical protein
VLLIRPMIVPIKQSQPEFNRKVNGLETLVEKYPQLKPLMEVTVVTRSETSRPLFQSR